MARAARQRLRFLPAALALVGAAGAATAASLPAVEARHGIVVAEERRAAEIGLEILRAGGNAVAATYTLNGYFGAGVVAPGTGFFLNNEMDDFTAKPGTANLYGLVQGAANAIAPGKRPLSSMAPTLVERDGKVFVVLGSPGGARIITSVLETIINLVDYGMAPQMAVDAPRWHFQGQPDKLFYEPLGLSPDSAALLGGIGYKLVVQKPWGATELIEVANGRLYGANDSRRPRGAAVGY